MTSVTHTTNRSVDAAALLALPALVPALPDSLLHGAASPVPVPHWVVLLVAVPLLWLLVGGVVLAIDRVLGRLE